MAYIQLDRKFFNNPLWKEARVYSKAEAWLDLIQMARFEASAELVNGKMIEVQRGEIPASRRFLELRWQWGSTRVSNFLKILVQQGMLSQRKSKGQTILTLSNCDSYNKPQTSGKPTTNQRQTSDKPATNQIKELKKEKELKEGNNIGCELKNSPHPTVSETIFSKGSEILKKEKVPQKRKSIEERAKEFKLKVWQIAKNTEFENVSILRKFHEYWTEHGENDRKMRFEKEKSFGIKRRLRTWFDNQEKFNRNGKNNSRNIQNSDPHSREFGEAIAMGIQQGLSALEQEQ